MRRRQKNAEAEYRTASLHPNGGVGAALPWRAQHSPVHTALGDLLCSHAGDQARLAATACHARPSNRLVPQAGAGVPGEPAYGERKQPQERRQPGRRRAARSSRAQPARTSLLEHCQAVVHTRRKPTRRRAPGADCTRGPAGEASDDLACSAAASQPCRPIRPKAVRAQPGALPLQGWALQSWARPSIAVAACAAAAAASAEAHQAAMAAHSAFYVPAGGAACAAPAAAGERQAAGSAEAGGSAMSTLLEAIGVLGACTRVKLPLQRTERHELASAVRVLLMPVRGELFVGDLVLGAPTGASACAELARRADARAAAGSSGDSAVRTQLPESASSNTRAPSASPAPQRSPSAERSSSGDLSACAAFTTGHVHGARPVLLPRTLGDAKHCAGIKCTPQRQARQACVALTRARLL